MVDLICSCGHDEKDHRMIRYIKPFPCIAHCGCVDFRLDNLLYLEELDKEYYLGS